MSEATDPITSYTRSKEDNAKLMENNANVLIANGGIDSMEDINIFSERSTHGSNKSGTL